MAGKEEKKQREKAPAFTIRADMPRAVRALMAAQEALGEFDERLVREFEMHEERNRA